jgi:hypothetical protein
MRFNTFRNLLAIPAALVVVGLCGGSFVLMRSCGGGGSGRAPRPLAAATPAVAATPKPLAAGGNDARRDQLIVDYLNAHPQATGDKIKDAFPRESFKVNIYADNGSATWNRLKIDYNRNERWEEKWDLENGQPAKRHVSTRDNEIYDKQYRWQGGQWVEKK